MGIINPRPKLQPDEVLRWKARANHVEGPSYSLYGMESAAGGQLIATNRRIFFQPSRVDRATGAKRWELPLDAITGIEVIDRDGEPFAGGMRKRLGIQVADGVEVFVVNRLEQKMAELRALLLLS
ncbi:MAG TPA: hypothetical protein VGO66_10420 [Solirubrobacterales bacterium]|jgi:hypothetical protein|nr:hypothetical protein [Solirubrobacterales bacterium]